MKQYRAPRTLGEAFGHGVDWHIHPMRPVGWKPRGRLLTGSAVLMSLSVAAALVVAANCLSSLRGVL